MNTLKAKILLACCMLLTIASFSVQAQKSDLKAHSVDRRCAAIAPFDFRLSRDVVFVGQPADLRMRIDAALQTLERKLKARADAKCAAGDCASSTCKGQLRISDHYEVLRIVRLGHGNVKALIKITVAGKGNCCC